VVALRYRLSNNKDATKIRRCPIDNLPDHVKRNIDLEPDDKRGAEWNSNKKGYFAKIQIEDSTGENYHIHPIEFIHNKETGTDNWYLLIERTTEQGTQYFTNKFG